MQVNEGAKRLYPRGDRQLFSPPRFPASQRSRHTVAAVPAASAARPGQDLSRLAVPSRRSRHASGSGLVAARRAVLQVTQRGLGLAPGLAVPQVLQGLARLAPGLALAQVTERRLGLTPDLALPQVAKGGFGLAPGLAVPEVLHRRLGLARPL